MSTETITTAEVSWDDPKEEARQAPVIHKGSTVMAVQNGVYTLESVEEQAKYAQFLIDKKLVSDTFKTSAQLIIAIQFCKDLNLPNSALSNFYVINGRPAVYGDTLIGLVMGSGLVADKKITWFDEEGKEIKLPKKGTKYFGCMVEYKRASHASYVPGVYTLDDKDIAKPTNPVWIKFWKDMIWRRADIRAVKALFPDALRGIEVADYLEDAQTKLDNVDRARVATNDFLEAD